MAILDLYFFQHMLYSPIQNICFIPSTHHKFELHILLDMASKRGLGTFILHFLRISSPILSHSWKRQLCIDLFRMCREMFITCDINIKNGLRFEQSIKNGARAGIWTQACWVGSNSFAIFANRFKWKLFSYWQITKFLLL